MEKYARRYSNNSIQGLGQYGLLGNIPLLAGKIIEELDRITPGNLQKGFEDVRKRSYSKFGKPKTFTDYLSGADRAAKAAVEQYKQPVENFAYDVGSAGLGALQEILRPINPQLAQKAGEQALAARQVRGTTGSGLTKGGLKTGLRGAGSTINTMLTAAGTARMPTKMGLSFLGLGGLLGGGSAALTGGDVATAVGRAAGRTPRIIGLTANITDPITQNVAGLVKSGLSTTLGQQIIGRAITGTGNVIEDEILQNLEGVPVTQQDRILSFGLGAVFSAGAEPQNWKQFKKSVSRDFGRYLKPAQIDGITKAVQKGARQFQDHVGFQAKSISDQISQGASKSQLDTLGKIQSGQKNLVEIEALNDLRNFLQGKGFDLQQGKIIPLAAGADLSEDQIMAAYEQALKSGDQAEAGRLESLIGARSQSTATSGRSSVQVELEQAALKQDWPTVKRVLDSIPEGDPNKASMENYFRSDVETNLGKGDLVDQLEEARKAGNVVESQRISDQIRQNAIAETQTPRNRAALKAAEQKGGAEVPFGMQAQPKGDVLEAEAAARGQQPAPVQKIITALEEAEPIRGTQEALYGAERAARAGQVAAVGEAIPGEAGFKAQKAQLKGELPKAEFTGIRQQLTQQDIDSLFDQVEATSLKPYQKITAKVGLAKLLQPEGGTVPTKGEIRLLNEVFSEDFTNAVLNNRPKFKVYMDNAAEVLNVSRALLASVDVSAPLRQGWLLVPRKLLTNPKELGDELVNMFKMFASEDAYQNSIKEIEARPTAELMDQAGLQITKIDDPSLTGREELFMSNLAEKIPGIGRVVRASDRAYTGFLNELRADSFDGLVKQYQNLELELNPQRLSSIAKFVNSASGRGDMGKFSQHAVFLNSTFFSPRLMASRFNALDPRYYRSLDPVVRKEALKSLITSASAALTVLTLAKLGGAEVTGDPTNADFGKVKIGNTRFDTTGGFGVYLRTAAQFLAGKITSSTTGKEIILNEGSFNPITRGDVLQRFFTSKENPVLSFATGLMAGRDQLGEEFRVGPEVIDAFIPFILQDVNELVREWGPAGALGVIPAAFGAGVQTYGKKIPEKGFTESGRRTIKYREPPGLGETFLNKITGKTPDFTPEQQEKLGAANLEKRKQQAVKDKIDSIKASVRKGEITAAEGRKRIQAVQRGEDSPLDFLKNILPPNIFGFPIGSPQQPTNQVDNSRYYRR